MAFIQIVDVKASNMDELNKFWDGWEPPAGSTVRRAIRCQDRDDPNRFVSIIFFDDYESAMVNSNLPETQAMAAKMGELIDGSREFVNLDVVQDMTH